MQGMSGIRGIGGSEPTVAERRAGADDSRSDRAHDDVETFGGGPQQRRRRRHALDVSVQTGTDRDRHFDMTSFAQRSQRVGQRDRQGAARELNVRDPRCLPDSRADRHDLAVQRTADDGQPGQGVRQRPPLLRMASSALCGRVGKLHHVSVAFRWQIEPARQIRAENIEATGSEFQLARLRVDEHVVAKRHRAGDPRICDTGNAVHLESGQTLDPLDDGGYPAASKRQHLERQPRAQASLPPSPRGLPR